MQPLVGEIIDRSVRYARLRVDCAILASTPRYGNAAAEREELDQRRTRAHDALIDACNVLSRKMRSLDMSIGWRRRLGDHRQTEGRSRIGDFACFLHCFVGLSAR